MKTQQNKHEVVIKGQKVGKPESPLARAPGGGWQKCNLSYATLKTQFTAETVCNGDCSQKLSSDLSKRIISRILRLLCAQTILTRPTLCDVAHFFLIHIQYYGDFMSPISFIVMFLSRNFTFSASYLLFLDTHDHYCLHYAECLICLSDLYSNGKMWDLNRW